MAKVKRPAKIQSPQSVITIKAINANNAKPPRIEHRT